MAKINRFEEFNNHGLSLAEYIRGNDKHERVELWIKALAFVVDWHLQPRHRNKEFFMSYMTIVKIFKGYGCECTLEGMQQAFRKLESDGFLKRVYASCKKTESINPNKWIYRKIKLHWPLIYKCTSIFDLKQSAYQNMPTKSRMRKFARKRPFSYTKNKELIFQKVLEEKGIGTYSSANNMFHNFVGTVSSQFYNPNRLIHNYTQYTTSDQDKENKDALKSYQDKYVPPEPASQALKDLYAKMGR